ncbi:hypothetical protein [Kibdelosporangium philippinense]
MTEIRKYLAEEVAEDLADGQPHLRPCPPFLKRVSTIAAQCVDRC